jgi:hypothetical protein
MCIYAYDSSCSPAEDSVEVGKNLFEGNFMCIHAYVYICICVYMHMCIYAYAYICICV